MLQVSAKDIYKVQNEIVDIFAISGTTGYQRLFLGKERKCITGILAIMHINLCKRTAQNQKNVNW